MADGAKRIKHLDKSDRRLIERYLKDSFSIRRIADMLGVNPSTISREIKSHKIKHTPEHCDCTNYFGCRRHKACKSSNSEPCEKLCRTCSKAKTHCNAYVQEVCDRAKANGTGVCNFCDKKYNCRHTRYIYKAKKAQEEADLALVNCRRGRDLSEERLNRINDIVTPCVRNGQSIYHIMQSHGEQLGISESTLRRMINDCQLETKNIDLRDAVTRKRRRKRSKGYKKMTVIKEGHKYNDFLEYKEKHEVAEVQMDCVEGKKSDAAVLLTLHFPIPHCQIALILPEHTSKGVVDGLDKIEIQLGLELFRECFPVILTDNGHEFSDLEGMERSCTVPGERRTIVFFCEPNRSDQRGAGENNHKYIRYIIPKGTSLEPYNQEDISLMMNHINSFRRKDLGGKTPYEFAHMCLPGDFFVLLGLEEIAADDVNLTQKLLVDRIKSRIASD